MELFDSHSQSSCFIRKFVLDVNRPFEHIDDIATQIARALKRPLHEPSFRSPARYSRDPLAYAEFIRVTGAVPPGTQNSWRKLPSP